jgi:PAS domain S-box-containing protein
MSENEKNRKHIEAREKFLGQSLDSTRKSYYPQLQRQLEKASENEKRLQTLLDNLPALISYVDSSERYIFTNKVFRKFTGLRSDQILGRSMEVVFGHEDYSSLKNHVRNALRGMTVRFESTKKLNSEERHLESTYVPDHNPQGEIIGFYIFSLDLTEKKKAETEKERLQTQLTLAQKMESVGRLAGGVAHDFNNMLSVIFGHAEMMLTMLKPEDPFYSSLLEIKKASERSTGLTRQLLAFARQQPVTPKVIDLNETTEGMLKMLRRLIGENIELAWLPETGLAPVLLDPSQVDQILANLCVNARDAIGGVGRITIETRNATIGEAYCANHPEAVPGEYVLLAVTDSGTGMTRETMNMLFEPFFTTKELGKGTGLGLATIYGIVKQNSGFISVFSEMGMGSTFEIYLPRHVENITSKTAESYTPEPPRGDETILIVEDEPSILAITKTMLEAFGYRVISAHNPGEAIRLAENFSEAIDLLMTDVVMPEMSGRELLERLLILRPEARHLFMSGYTGDIIAHHGILDEGVNFIQKPFSMHDLAVKVRQILDRK